jgi:hypothetical protein
MNSLDGGSVQRLYIQKITQRDSNPRSSVQRYSTNAVSKISRFVSHYLFRNYLRGPLVTNDVECTSDERAKCWWRSLCWREGSVTMRIRITVFLNTNSVTPFKSPTSCVCARNQWVIKTAVTVILTGKCGMVYAVFLILWSADHCWSSAICQVVCGGSPGGPQAVSRKKSITKIVSDA